MKKKIIKLIFDSLITITAFVFSWLLLAWGLEYLFYSDAFYLVSFQILTSLVEFICGCLMICFIFIDIKNIIKERSKKDGK